MIKFIFNSTLWPLFPQLCKQTRQSLNESRVPEPMETGIGKLNCPKSYEPGATVWRERGGGQSQVQGAQMEADLQRRAVKGAMDPDPKKGTTREREREEEEEEEKDFL